MAINPESQYPGKIAPSTPDYPFGVARNITVPGDGTGTPWEAALVNDLFGWQQALLSEAGSVPSGTPEKVGASQYLAASKFVSGLVRPSYAAVQALDSSGLVDGTKVFIAADYIAGGYVLDKTDTTTVEDLGLTLVDSAGGRWKRKRSSAEVSVTWFGASPAENDNAPFFQAAIDTGAVSVFVPDLGDGYIVRTSFKQLKNTRFYGELRGIESQYVSGPDDPNQGQRGTVLLMRDNAQIQHDAGCEIDHLCFRYDEQNYEILTGGGDPDGLTNFTVYPPTIKYVGDSDGSVNVHHILALGAYILYESPDGLNIEKPTFEHIRGWVLRYGFDIEKCADMAKFYDIHFNPKVMFQLPEYNRDPGTNYTNDKYTHYIQMFRLGRVDGGYIDNCFIYACQTFCRIKQVTGVSGGSIRISNSAADICNTMLSIDQTQRGFGFAIENCWITPAINKIVKDDGVFATVKSGWIRITDDGTNKPENVHVELSDCKTSAGGLTVGFTDSAPYEEQFHFSANASSTNNSMIITNCHFDEISGWDNADPVSSLVTGVTDNLNHICSFDHCFGRFALTDVYTKFSDDKKSAGTSYSREISKHRTFMAGSHLTADFAFEGREFGDPNRYAAEWMLKNAGGDILIEQLLKGANIYRYLNAANGHTVFPLGVFNEGHLVLGSEASGIHIFRNGNDLRISAGPPASSTDGTLLGTAT